MAKIKDVIINKPPTPLTRPRLCNYAIKPQKKKFSLEIIPPPPKKELEEEI